MRRKFCRAYSYTDIISIHAPLTGCDYLGYNLPNGIAVISIHAPLTGCDGGTHRKHIWNQNFNPRTPYGMRPEAVTGDVYASKISIHAPLTGCDDFLGTLFNVFNNFNPRTPYGMRLVERCRKSDF